MLTLEILPITLASWEIANLWRSCSSQVVRGYYYYYYCPWKCKKSDNNKMELFCSSFLYGAESILVTFPYF